MVQDLLGEGTNKEFPFCFVDGCNDDNEIGLSFFGYFEDLVGIVLTTVE